MDKLVQIANSLFAIAQNGLVFSKDPFDIERYHQIKAIAGSILADKSILNFDTIMDLFANEEGYATPKIDVRGVVFKDDKVLLVQEGMDSLWSLPGGWIDINESPGESICREIREESGYETKAVKLMAVYDKNKHPHPTQLPHAYKLFFICELVGGSKKIGIETLDADFFDKDKLPPLSLNRVTACQIARAYIHKENMQLPTDFD